MTLLLLAAVILCVPVLTACIALAENARAGELGRLRRLCPQGLALAQLGALVDSVWSLWLTVLALPFGLIPGCCTGRGPAPSRLPPVILVHGLYHNPAAWFVMRRRLALAGFTDVRAHGYASFGRNFADIAGGLARLMLEAAKGAPGGRVLLVGHSLGGLVIRAACADARLGGTCRVAGIVTLGTPHQGSTLAGMLAVGRLGRGLAPGGEVIRLLRALPACRAQALSLYTPTDNMVLPLGGALLSERERAAGWRESALPPMSHVGLLYSGEAAREAIGFLRERTLDSSPG